MDQKQYIENLLKKRIGTSYLHDDSKEHKVFALKGYGRNVLVVYDEERNTMTLTQIIYPSLGYHFVVNLEQDQPGYEEAFVASIKMMIELRKKEEGSAR